MVEIYKVEVSSNGRTHIKYVDDNPDITLKSIKEIDSKRKELKEFYSQKFPDMESVTIYLSYREK